MDPSSFLQGRTRETTIRRDAEGRWFYDGEPLEHPNLTHAFDCWIARAEDGRYCLKNDINWAYFTLEGPPYFVRKARVDETSGQVMLTLSDDRVLPLDARTLREDERGALYCEAGDGMVAGFSRHAMQQLEDLLREDEQGVYLALGQERVRPPRVRDPLAQSP